MKLKYYLEDLIKNNPITEKSFQELDNKCKSILNNKCERKIYISSIDTGLGKSTFIKAFLSEIKSEGFKKKGGILICLNSLSEVEELVKNCPLESKDVAVYTGDNVLNDLTGGSRAPNDAFLMITTQAMIHKRTYKKLFSKSSEFFYRGKPRDLRIWDEAILPSTTIHISCDDIVKLYAQIRPLAHDWIAGLEEFENEVKSLEDGEIVTVPERFGTGAQFRFDPTTKAGLLNEQEAETVAQLLKAAGRKVRIYNSRWGVTLVGVGPSLPDDIAPLIVLDASARVMDRYKLWAKHRGNVVFLPPAVRDYCNLSVSIAKVACGKQALSDHQRRRRLVNKIANVIDEKPNEKWLIIYPKDRRAFALSREIADEVLKPANVRYLHWGIHYGTNEFADVKNIVVVGAFEAPPTAYLAEYAAVTRLELEKLEDDHRKQVRVGTLKANVLQAFSRGNIRNGTGNVCGECTVYFMAPQSMNPEQLVRETFPGCKIESWGREKLKGQAKALRDAVMEMMEDGKVGPVTKEDVRLAAGIGSRSRFSQVLAGPVKVELESLGVKFEHKSLVLPAVVTPISSKATASSCLSMILHGNRAA